MPGRGVLPGQSVPESMLSVFICRENQVFLMNPDESSKMTPVSLGTDGTRPQKGLAGDFVQTNP